MTCLLEVQLPQFLSSFEPSRKERAGQWSYDFGLQDDEYAPPPTPRLIFRGVFSHTIRENGQHH